MQSQTKDLLALIEKKKSPTAPSPFTALFHTEVKHKKNLTPPSFKRLKTVLLTDYRTFLTFTPTKNESIVIGRALMKTKILDKQSLVDFIASKNDTSSIIILYSYLCTKAKVDLTSVIALLKRFLNTNVCVLDVLKLLLVVFRNYGEWFDVEMMQFCRGYEHGICKEIVREYDGADAHE